MISLAFILYPKISYWHSLNMHLLLRNLSHDLAVLHKGWNMNFSFCLQVVCIIGLILITLFAEKIRKTWR